MKQCGIKWKWKLNVSHYFWGKVTKTLSNFPYFYNPDSYISQNAFQHVFLKKNDSTVCVYLLFLCVSGEQEQNRDRIVQKKMCVFPKQFSSNLIKNVTKSRKDVKNKKFGEKESLTRTMQWIVHRKMEFNRPLI